MLHDQSPLACWTFAIHPDGSWSALYVRGDGTANPVSGPHADFGKAVAEALRLGFDPEGHVWVVEHRHWATHYAPGARPVNVPRAAPAETSTHRADTARPQQK